MRLAEALRTLEERLDPLGGVVLVVLWEDEPRPTTGRTDAATRSGGFGSIEGLGHEAPV